MMEIHGKITESCKDSLRACLPEVMEHYKHVQPSKRKDRPYLVCCPFHNERTPSMQIDPTKGVYHCFGCGKSGDVFTLVAEEEHLDLNRVEDFKRVSSIIAGIGRVAIITESTQEQQPHPSSPSKPDKPTPPPASPPKPVEYIPMSAVNAMAGRARETSLYMWLCRYFAPAEVDLVFAMYRVGASKFVNHQGGRAVSFPYMADADHCVDCKIFNIDPNTGSRKTAPPLRTWTAKDGSTGQLSTTWALAEMKKKDLRAPWCNFGDHLLSMRPDAKVCVVESEKSAIILSLAYPDQIWVAVGSMQNLNAERFKPYRGRKVTIFPDRDGYKTWSEKAEVLARDCSMSVDTTILRYVGKPKDDFADIVIRSLEGMQTTPVEPTPESQPQVQLSPDEKQALDLWAQMQANNPHLSEFAKELSLTPVRVVPNKTTNHGEDKQ